MTTHPEHDVLLALADRELTDVEAREVERHIATCTACSGSLSTLQHDAHAFASLLHVLDSTEPVAWQSSAAATSGVAELSGVSEIPSVADMSGAALPDVADAGMDGAFRRGDVLPLRRPQARASARPSRPSMLRWAAGILLVSGAAASAAIVTLDIWPSTASSPDPDAPDVRATAAEGVATVIGVPANDALIVELSNAGPDVRLHITLSDADAAPSVSVAGTDAPRFVATAGRIEVALGAGTSAVRVTVPRTLRFVDVSLDGASVATVAGGTVRPAAAAHTDGIRLEAANPP